jgi:hypothetical protein
MARKLVILGLVSLALFAYSVVAQAATSVAWISPPDGSEYCVGTVVAPTGQASATGTVGGSGLDLALVLDSSGSMQIVESGKSRGQWQKEAAIALVNVLPEDTTSVAVVEFDSDANTIRLLTGLTVDKAAIIAAINSVDESGGTTIGTGIYAARVELTSVRHTVGRARMMVVMSDGQSSGLPGENADQAIAAGIDAIHSVGLPGHSVTTMRSIVDGVDDTYGTADDHGVYTGVSDLTTLESIFTGTGGSLVGIDHVDVTLPDGSTQTVPVDGLGNFVSPNYALALGPNTFTATAYATDNTTATADLTLNGKSCDPYVIPEPSTVILFGFGILGLAGVVVRKKTKK